MEIYFRKGSASTMLPDTKDDLEKLKGFAVGEIVRAEVTRPRNHKFHKKLMALFSYAFDHWEQPDSENKHGSIQKSFDCFRRDLTILAGFYDQVYRVDGSVRVEAKSISFAKMSQEEFDKLYGAVIDVILKHVLTTHTKQDVVDGVMGFV